MSLGARPHSPCNDFVLTFQERHSRLYSWSRSRRRLIHPSCQDMGNELSKRRRTKGFSPAGCKLPADVHVSIPAQRLRQGRTIIVGDIHGCATEFRQLLETVDYKPGHDLLILAGDLVNKGPASAEVVRLARSVGALAVRGNHDDVATSAYNILLKGGRLNKPTLWGWVSDLTPEDAAYLDSLPFTISLPSLQVIVVHAGLVPGIKVIHQRHVDLTKMRDVVPLDKPHPRRKWLASEKSAEDGVPWGSQWMGSRHVFYGHDAVRGLQLHPFATGLDTGCCYGGALTAAVIPPLGSRQHRRSSWPFRRRTSEVLEEALPDESARGRECSEAEAASLCCSGRPNDLAGPPRFRLRRAPSLEELGAELVSVPAQAVYVQPEGGGAASPMQGCPEKNCGSEAGTLGDGAGSAIVDENLADMMQIMNVVL